MFLSLKFSHRMPSLGLRKEWHDNRNINIGLKSAPMNRPRIQSHNFRLWLNLGIVYFVWGSTYAGIAVAGRGFPPLSGMGIRFLIAAGLMATFLKLRGKHGLRISRTEFFAVSQLGILLLVGGIGAVSAAAQHIPSGYVSLLICGTPLYLAVYRTIAGDRPSLRSLFGVLVGIVGMFVLVLVGSPPGAGETADSVFFWSAVVVIGSISWSLGSFRAKHMKLPKDPLVLTMWQMFMGGLTLTILGFGSGEKLNLQNIEAESWIALVYIILFGSIIAYTSYIWLLENAPISLVATYSYVNPLVAVVIGVGFLGESLELNMVVGGAIVLAGVVITITAEKPKAP
jgi:drug/metabolite transporter (DMT)-like permease